MCFISRLKILKVIFPYISVRIVHRIHQPGKDVIQRSCSNFVPAEFEKCPQLIESRAFNLYFVGVTGFEPATTWSQTRCATGLRYAPMEFFRFPSAKLQRFF